MPDQPSLREASDRLDAVLRRLDAHTDPAVQEAAREAVALLMTIQRAALDRILEAVADPALGGPALVSTLADDPVVGPLLTIHDLHPHPPEVRVARAVERLRARIAASGCRLSGAAVQDGVARVRIAGWSRLGAEGAAEMRRWLEPAVLEFAPELAGMHVEDEDGAAHAPANLIQITRSTPR